MWNWLRRVFGRKEPAPDIRAADIAVVPVGYGEDAEKSVPTLLVPRQSSTPTPTPRARREAAPAEATMRVRPLARNRAEPSTPQAAAALTPPAEEGPRAEIVIQPEDGTGLPVLPADLAPETTAIPRLVDDAEVTRRLPPLSERMKKE
jgi:hypothetical protein